MFKASEAPSGIFIEASEAPHEFFLSEAHKKPFRGFEASERGLLEASQVPSEVFLRLPRLPLIPFEASKVPSEGLRVANVVRVVERSHI